MDKSGLRRYLIKNIDLALQSNETSFRQSYDIKIIDNPDGFLFIPVMPIQLTMDSELYYKIYNIVSFAVYPEYTLIRPDTMKIVANESSSISRERAFFFPWKKGVSNRLVGKIDYILNGFNLSNGIPLMDNVIAGWNIHHAIICGPSGSGKSTGLRYLCEVGHRIGKVIVIDGKLSDAARWGRKYEDVELVVPSNEDRPADFLIKVLERLASLTDEIYERQKKLYGFTTRISTNVSEIGKQRIFVVIDELASLSLSGKRGQVQELMDQLQLIAFLGREANVSLIISTQNPRVNGSGLPTGVRDQFGLKILLGPIDSSRTQFLFPDLDKTIPLPMGGPGSGIVEIDDGEHFGIEPIAMPTIQEESNNGPN